jgi:hypothetical protein
MSRVVETQFAQAAPLTALLQWPDRKSDRNAFLLLVIAIWAGILVGFVPEMIQHVREHRPFPLIVHLHAIAFVGWLVLLTVQLFLIRAARYELHRRVGLFGAGLAAVMIVIGPATAFYMQRLHFGTAESDPAFLAVQLTDIIAFAGLVTAAIGFRALPAAHKRLMLLATLYISDAGFARAFGDGLHALLGDGFFPFLAEAYLANDILVIALGVYDYATRRRLHPAYVAGVVWTLALQFLGSALYQAAWWKPVSLTLIGH